MSKSRKPKAEPAPQADEPVQPEGVSGVRALIDSFEKSLQVGDMKISVTEYIRLVQLEREVKAIEPCDIEVTWIERLEGLNDGAD
jgi:hypothetical protein